MRILIMGLNFYPELTGIGKYTGELAAFLSSNEHDVRVITTPPYYPHWKVDENYQWWLYKKEKWNDIEIFRCPLWVPRKLSGLKRILSLLSFAVSSLPVLFFQAVWKPDLVFAIAPAIFSVPAAAFFAKVMGAKSWLHIQDFEVDAAIDLGMFSGPKISYTFVEWFERAVFSRFDKISTISKRMEELLWDKGISKNKTTLFPNWIDTDSIFPLDGPSVFRAELALRDDQVVVLYSGNMGEKQGIEVLVKTAKLMRDDQGVIFILCGDGAARPGLMAQASELSNVLFLPLQPEQRLNELLNLADIHVLPQRTEVADLVMPSKLTGMLASGKPVIALANENTQISKIVSEVGIIIKPENPLLLSQTIKELAEDYQKRIRLGCLGSEFARENWDSKKVLMKLLGQFEQIVKKMNS